MASASSSSSTSMSAEKAAALAEFRKVYMSEKEMQAK
jgi:hypothetical protein